MTLFNGRLPFKNCQRSTFQSSRKQSADLDFKRWQVRRSIHNALVAPLFRAFGTRIIRSRLLLKIGQPSYFLDASVGDDPLILHISNDRNFVLGNDICPQLVEPLKRKVAGRNIIFTLYDVKNLPLSGFEVVLWKNCLHHMQDIREAERALASLSQVARRIIVVDIEDPKRSSRRAYFWNQYYKLFLGDDGDLFFNYAEFKELINRTFPHAAIDFQTIQTIKGRYMVADVYQLAKGNSLVGVR